MLTDYISVKPIIEHWIEDNPLEGTGVSKSQLYRWANDTIKDFSVVDTSKHKIALIPISNTKGELPKGFHKVLSVAYRLYPKKGGRRTSIDRVVQYTQKQGEDCDIEINLKCSGCKTDTCTCKSPIVEVDVNKIWEMQNPWYYNASSFGMPFDSNDHIRQSKKSKFQIIPAATSSYFNAKFHVGNCLNLQCNNCPYRYKIEDTNLIEVDIQDKENEVELLVSYLGKRMDSDGNLLVPNITDAREAIDYQLSYRFYRKLGLQEDKASYERESEKSLVRRDIAIGRARSKLVIPEIEDLRAELSETLNRQTRNSGPTRPTFNGRDHMKY